MLVAVSYRYFPDEKTKKDPEKFVEGAKRFIRKYIEKQDKVVNLVSGGVDSSVNTAIFCLAIGDGIYTTHIDTGFMRLIRGREEPEIVSEKFSELNNFQLLYARDIFYEKVFGILDAEEKRKGFQEAYRITTDRLVASIRCNAMTHATILPDIKETPVVKTQHNVDVPFKKVKKVIEHLAGLCKNEVRRIAKYLFEEYGFKFLENVATRQPFPGPGLSVRTVGTINLGKLNTEKEANDIVEQRVDEYAEKQFGARMYIDPETEEQIPFQSFAATFDNRFRDLEFENLGNAVAITNRIDKLIKRLDYYYYVAILDTKSTGIKNGKRVYSFPLCLIPEETEELDYSILLKIGSKIPAKFGFSRVLYKVANGDEKAPYAVAIRSVRSVDAITAKVLEIPLEFVKSIGNEIVRRCKVEGVYWDISGKPPATIEYE